MKYSITSTSYSTLYFKLDTTIKHREGDKPAFVGKDGTKKWYFNNLLHREGDRPAIQDGDGTQYYFKYGKLHRLHGPAIIHQDGTSEF